MSVRSAVALKAGADEAILAKVDDCEHSDLTDTQKAALQVADVYLSSPADVSDEVKKNALEHLSSAQIAETVLHLMQYSSDKMMVALGLDLTEMSRIEM